MLRVLYVGRFQPLHLGHLKVIENILRKVDELVIIIGTAQVSHELDNPFTAGERIMMLRSALNGMRIDPLKYYLIPVPDATMHSVWVSEVVAYSPPFEAVYTNDPLTSRLFKEFGVRVVRIPFFKREIYSATEIRRRMLIGENWKVLLHGTTVKIIEEIEGVARLKELAVEDY